MAGSGVPPRRNARPIEGLIAAAAVGQAGNTMTVVAGPERQALVDQTLDRGQLRTTP